MTSVMPDQIYSSLVHRALDFAAIKHVPQHRKHPTQRIPYISHPACVGYLLAKAGYGEEVVAAGVLHDVIEDCGVTQEDLARMFTPLIASLVAQVSEPAKRMSWEDRKSAYFAKLEAAPPEALAIAAADHLHNIKSLLIAAQADLSAISMFKVDIGRKMEYEKRCADLFRERLGGPLADEFTASIVEFESFHVR